MTYRRPDGSTFVLASYAPGEWGRLLAARLLALGCSSEYAAALARGYEAAVPA